MISASQNQPKYTELTNMTAKYVTPEKLAEELETTAGTLATWRHTGRYNLPFIKVGRKVLYRVEDVQKWLESRTHQHTGEA